MTIYDHDQIDLFSNDNADLGNFVSINLWLDGFVVFAVPPPPLISASLRTVYRFGHGV